MTDRTLDEAMGMTRDEIAQMRAKVDRLARPRRIATEPAHPRPTQEAAR